METIIIYRCTSADRCMHRRTENRDTYTLMEPQNISHLWYSEEIRILPEGFTICESEWKDKQIYNKKGEHCQIVNSYQGNPILIDSEGFHSLLKPIVAKSYWQKKRWCCVTH